MSNVQSALELASQQLMRSLNPPDEQQQQSKGASIFGAAGGSEIAEGSATVTSSGGGGGEEREVTSIMHSRSLRSIDAHLSSVKSTLKEYIQPSVKSEDREANKLLEKRYEEMLFQSMTYTHDNRFTATAAGGTAAAAAAAAAAAMVTSSSSSSHSQQQELLDWQHFSVAQSVKMVTGPKMTLVKNYCPF